MVEAHVVACTPEYSEMMNLHAKSGEFISDIHVDERSNVCVLASEVAARFFPIDDPLGKKRIKN